MNEELQKQLIEILNSLKTGITPAYTELMTQRIGYFSMCSSTYLIYTIFCAIVAILSSSIIFRAMKKVGPTGIPSELCISICIFMGISALMSTLGACFNFAQYRDYAIKAAYPLGQVLDQVIK